MKFYFTCKVKKSQKNFQVISGGGKKFKKN
jgi:hypothetical protein